MEKRAGEVDLSKVPVSVDVLYSEGAQMFRHYSNCSLTIRLSAIIQGLAIAYAGGYLFQEDRFLYALIAALFGLCFTGVLLGIYWAYDQAVNDFQRTLETLEDKPPAEAEKKATSVSPFSYFAAARKKRYKSFAVRLVTLYGAFSSVGLAFIVIAVLSALQLAK